MGVLLHKVNMRGGFDLRPRDKTGTKDVLDSHSWKNISKNYTTTLWG